MNAIERYEGCLTGLATGDALGSPVQFAPPGEFEPVTEMLPSEQFDTPAGAWTDDTSMALCLAESLVEMGGFDEQDQMERYLKWLKEGYYSTKPYAFDVGGTVNWSLVRFESTGNPFSGPDDPNTAGNGSIMRLAPVPMAYALQPMKAIELSGTSSKTTHGARAAVDACRFLGGLIVGALEGVEKEELLAERYSPVPGYWEIRPLAEEIDAIAAGSYKSKEPPEIVGSGYVVECLEAALWAFNKSDSFGEGCLLAVNLGGDADSTAAVYGQLAGAHYGLEAIPEEWRAVLYMNEQIIDLADRLFELSNEVT